jgi:hypothetical protein
MRYIGVFDILALLYEAIMELAASRRNSIDLLTSGRGSKKAMD